MRCLRTTSFALLCALSFGLAAVALAAPGARSGKVPERIVFPVIGPAQYVDDFGDARPQGGHEGNDIMSSWRALAVAAEGGRVEFDRVSRGAGGCMLNLYGTSGTKYTYIHLNNDLTRRNDNRGRCVPGTAFAPDLKSGDRVAAGQLVGYVGDSGDANGIQPHLHFEVHPGGGAAVSPFKHLRRAWRLLFYAPPGSTFTLGLKGKVVANEAGSLRLQVDVLHSWPARQRITRLGRTLTVAVPPGLLVERAAKKVSVNLGGRVARKGQQVTVYTQPELVTRAAQLGKNGTLVAERVVIERKSP